LKLKIQDKTPGSETEALNVTAPLLGFTRGLPLSVKLLVGGGGGGGGAGFAVKFATTCRLALNVIVQVVVPLHAPLHPENVEPAAGAAVRVTCVPVG
jgi:hypothetical protein